MSCNLPSSPVSSVGSSMSRTAVLGANRAPCYSRAQKCTWRTASCRLLSISVPPNTAVLFAGPFCEPCTPRWKHGAQLLKLVLQSLQHAINRADDDRDNPSPRCSCICGFCISADVALPLAARQRAAEGCGLLAGAFLFLQLGILKPAVSSAGQESSSSELLVKQRVNVHLNLALEHRHARITCETEQEWKEMLITLFFPAEER